MFLGSSSYFMKIHQHDNDGIISWLIAWRFKVSNLTVSYNCTLKVVTIGKSYDRVLRRFGWFDLLMNEWSVWGLCVMMAVWCRVCERKKNHAKEHKQWINLAHDWYGGLSPVRHVTFFFAVCGFCCLLHIFLNSLSLHRIIIIIIIYVVIAVAVAIFVAQENNHKSYQQQRKVF